MARKNIEDVRNVTCVGAGPIGGGWTAHFLGRGYDVTCYMHDPSEEDALRRMLDTAWKCLEQIGLAGGASLDRLTCTSDLAEAVANADFVQESVPENIDLKQSVYEQLGDLVPADVVIASSTSGLSMTDIQAKCSTPERTVVAHPFNPPYLLPLVEMVGGEKTSPDALTWAAEFYTHTGKAPLIMTKEVPGFVATRIQEAVWREALHMVENGEATPEQIDIAMVNGPGPRWAFGGPFMTYHIGGGEGGMAYCLDQFGPALKLPWTRLEAPELTKELRDNLVDDSETRAAGRTFSDLSEERDAGLVAVAQAWKKIGKLP
ncbi:MAG: 3-hydroxybutyryl-CoA dehydrogenase [Rhodospirillales bacterium]|jgi:carnitine 3-dehydrogenase|nr:3-hydroxybutyryl-CoA dehydrogenase [Rhodospirillales bacterium]MBT4041196.1 3-hydroxybutyryl-CoA dehydrogenase [Rhodospirillales bacterium]MBT4625119.1 3-hydroxybutyryl-CoA dehydrogenase [Rhodospirillales bacterium]MBT5353323.1 3-hydroxybutyryl-CoA dehydrogenase [Rhodospirillales bacterium]MBT5520162.1 3-hydroxybutyryl-CoA dehydrogenase [Rhodospirillales bacterium]